MSTLFQYIYHLSYSKYIHIELNSEFIIMQDRRRCYDIPMCSNIALNCHQVPGFPELWTMLQCLVLMSAAGFFERWWWSFYMIGQVHAANCKPTRPQKAHKLIYIDICIHIHMKHILKSLDIYPLKTFGIQHLQPIFGPFSTHLPPSSWRPSWRSGDHERLGRIW